MEKRDEWEKQSLRDRPPRQVQLRVEYEKYIVLIICDNKKNSVCSCFARMGHDVL